MTSTLLVLVLLSQAEQPAPSSAGALPPLAASSVGRWRYLTRLEATGLALLPSSGGDEAEHYAQLTPTLVMDGGEALSLGPPRHLRVDHAR